VGRGRDGRGGGCPRAEDGAGVPSTGTTRRREAGVEGAAGVARVVCAAADGGDSHAGEPCRSPAAVLLGAWSGGLPRLQMPTTPRRPLVGEAGERGGDASSSSEAYDAGMADFGPVDLAGGAGWT